MVSITLINVSKRFGEVLALNNIDLRIEQGEMFFLLGPSGCGKTTLLRTIAGFYTPDQGQVFFDEVDVTHRAPYKRKTAMVFQNYALWPHMNVGQNVAFGLHRKKLPRGIVEERVKKALRMVKMEDYGSRKITQLSGGQQQRVALARSLVVEPQCLLLDEPLSNLDTQLRLEMRGEIRRICQEAGVTTIYVTHDQKEALSMGDRLGILENGSLVQTGPPVEVYRSPLTRGIASFIGETNFIPGRLIEPASDPNYWVVETRAGNFEGRLANTPLKPKYNDRVTLSIRPECFFITPGPSEKNALRGKIAGKTYLGEIVQYDISAEELGATLKLSEINPRLLAGKSEETCYLEALPEDVVILQR